MIIYQESNTTRFKSYKLFLLFAYLRFTRQTVVLANVCLCLIHNFLRLVFRFSEKTNLLLKKWLKLGKVAIMEIYQKLLVSLFSRNTSRLKLQFDFIILKSSFSTNRSLLFVLVFCEASTCTFSFSMKRYLFTYFSTFAH